MVGAESTPESPTLREYALQLAEPGRAIVPPRAPTAPNRLG